MISSGTFANRPAEYLKFSFAAKAFPDGLMPNGWEGIVTVVSVAVSSALSVRVIAARPPFPYNSVVDLACQYDLYYSFSS